MQVTKNGKKVGSKQSMEKRHKIYNLSEISYDIAKKRHKNVNLDDKKLQTSKKSDKPVKKKVAKSDEPVKKKVTNYCKEDINQ